MAKLDWFGPGRSYVTEPLLDISDLARLTGIPDMELEAYLSANGDRPAADYDGIQLWLVDTLRDLLVDKQQARDALRVKK